MSVVTVPEIRPQCNVYEMRTVRVYLAMNPANMMVSYWHTLPHPLEEERKKMTSKHHRTILAHVR